MSTGQALVVVAHPDDETIWMGGTILRHPAVRWTIFVLCRRDDSDRMPKFLKVAKRYGARGIISDLEDEGIMCVSESIPEIKRRLRREMRQKKFDYIFTHGTNGEYGHPRHIGVHRAVQEFVDHGELSCGKFYLFSYATDDRRRIINREKGASAFVKLGRGELREKRRIVKEFYGFSTKSFENVSCLPVELFRKAK